MSERTPEQRDAVMQDWPKIAEADGWEVDPDPTYWAAVDGITWSLIEQTMDTADREPSVETVQAARRTAERILAATPTDEAAAAGEGGRS